MTRGMGNSVHEPGTGAGYGSPEDPTLMQDIKARIIKDLRKQNTFGLVSIALYVISAFHLFIAMILAWIWVVNDPTVAGPWGGRFGIFLGIGGVLAFVGVFARLGAMDF